jgi:hypothetical protein
MTENSVSNPSPNSTLGLIDLPEGSFKHDLSITDRYQSFSAELLRLALLGIAGIGFLLANVFVKDVSNPSYKAFVGTSEVRSYLIKSLWCLGLSSVFALLHRYFSTDSMACHLRYVRLRERKGCGDRPKANKEKRGRQWRFHVSYWLLWVSAVLLGTGAILLALSFISWLNAMPAAQQLIQPDPR